LKFRIELNSYRWSQKSPVVIKYLLNKFNCFYGTVVSVVGVSVLGGQYKDFREIQDLDHC